MKGVKVKLFEYKGIEYEVVYTENRIEIDTVETEISYGLTIDTELKEVKDVSGFDYYEILNLIDLVGEYAPGYSTKALAYAVEQLMSIEELKKAIDSMCLSDYRMEKYAKARRAYTEYGRLYTPDEEVRDKFLHENKKDIVNLMLNHKEIHAHYVNGLVVKYKVAVIS